MKDQSLMLIRLVDHFDKVRFVFSSKIGNRPLLRYLEFRIQFTLVPRVI